jgi:cytochrome c oxidase subunit II
MNRKSTFTAALFTLAFALLASLPATAQDAKKITIVAHRFSYEPSDITLKKGEPVTLVIQSQDVDHGLRVRELNLDAKIKGGGTTEVTITPQETGDFTGHCSTFCGAGHGGMALTFHVVN